MEDAISKRYLYKILIDNRNTYSKCLNDLQNDYIPINDSYRILEGQIKTIDSLLEQIFGDEIEFYKEN